MSRFRAMMVLLSVGVLFGLLTLGCGLLSKARLVEAWTPSPLAGQFQQVATPLPLLPTVAPAAVEPTRLSTVAPAVPPTAAVRSAASTTPTALPPNVVVIRQEDIADAVDSGAHSQPGLTADKISVEFVGDNTQITTAYLAYGPIEIQNLKIVGRLYAQGGVLQFEPESITPSGLVTAAIPTLLNQALAKYSANWYVEDVRTRDGCIELTVQ